jgi:tetratricopeptide (TPR) repeat protein
VVLVWPLSDYAPQAQYLVARCYEATGKAEKAFKAYQKLLEKQPKIANFDEIGSGNSRLPICSSPASGSNCGAIPLLSVNGAHGQDVR